MVIYAEWNIKLLDEFGMGKKYVTWNSIEKVDHSRATWANQACYFLFGI